MDIGQSHDLIPISNVDVSTSGILKISESATWQYDGEEIEDPKLFLYLTATSLDI